MILIISQKENEYATESVIEWLDHFNAEYIRLNGSDLVNEIWNLRICNTGQAETNLFDPKIINAVWCRRWNPGEILHNWLTSELSRESERKMHWHLKRELQKVRQFLFKSMDHAYWMPHYSIVDVNKLEILELAVKAGLIIPDTLITTNKKDLLCFFEEHNGKVISKTIGDIEIFFDRSGESAFSLYTERVTEETLEGIPEFFFPSLFQKLLEKQEEYRIFFLEDELYPMVIHSQLDSKTEVDFRHYNKDKPGRKGPVVLPTWLKQQIISFIKSTGLNTGSLDFVLTKEGKFVFLEVNPVGQFNYLSEACNYKIEKNIAELLIKKDEERKQRKTSGTRTHQKITNYIS